jgi:hypothetical protein
MEGEAALGEPEQRGDEARRTQVVSVDLNPGELRHGSPVLRSEPPHGARELGFQATQSSGESSSRDLVTWSRD